jgi:hypothetical protein
MSIPTNKKLYEEVKAEVYAKYPKHSAYRSGLLVKEYKRRGGTYEGKEKQTEGLNRWFLENWKNQRGEVGLKHKNDVYRPTVRITKETPTTFKELTPQEIEAARREKYLKGRVLKFKK